MAGSITISNTFVAQAGPIPLSQLDTNFSQAVTALNSTLTFSNYYQDTGAVNALVVTVTSPQTASYTAGLTLDVRVAVTNTGASTINVNGLGVKSITTVALGALGAGAMPANAIVTLKYDGTQFQLVSGASTLAIGGSTTQIQYNNAGVLAGSSMTYTPASGVFLIPAPVSGVALTIAGGGISVSGASTLGTTNPVTISAAGIVGVTGDNTNASLDVFTPNNGTTGGFRLRGNATSGNALIQVTNSTAGAQWGFFKVVSSGVLLWNGLPNQHSMQITDYGGSNSFDVGYLGLPLSANTTLALADRGKSIQATGTITVPNSVFAAGDTVVVYNNSAGAITLTASITTMRLAGTATTGGRTIAQRGWATIYFVSGTECSVAGPGVT